MNAASKTPINAPTNISRDFRRTNADEYWMLYSKYLMPNTGRLPTKVKISRYQKFRPHKRNVSLRVSITESTLKDSQPHSRLTRPFAKLKVCQHRSRWLSPRRVIPPDLRHTVSYPGRDDSPVKVSMSSSGDFRTMETATPHGVGRIQWIYRWCRYAQPPARVP